MNRYILQPEDSIRILPPQNDSGAAIELFSGRSMIFFDVQAVTSVCLLHGVIIDAQRSDAFCFEAPDKLLGILQQVLIPTEHPGASAFQEQLKRYAPDGLDFSAEADYLPPRCDHRGGHHV